MNYDYVIVGSGLFGATFANLAKHANKSCLILEKRKQIAGNCYTENVHGIDVHNYGPHIFHTSNVDIWNYVNKFAKFNNYVNRPKVRYKDKLYSFPINLFTLYQLWGCSTPEDARKRLEEVRVKIENPSNLEEWILSQVGEELYHTFVYGYTKKKWGTDPKNLPSFIIKRLPIRLNFDDNYYNDTYQGIPKGGYTQMVQNMIRDIPIEMDVNFNDDIDYWCKKGKHVIYTGALDEFFCYTLGELQYRSLRFEQELLPTDDFQGNAIVNFTEESVAHTRIVEHKHFDTRPSTHTVITREYPQMWNRGLERYYPINNEVNNTKHDHYKLMCQLEYPNIILGGRLAYYKYMDMHQVVGQAMHKFAKSVA